MHARTFVTLPPEALLRPRISGPLPLEPVVLFFQLAEALHFQGHQPSVLLAPPVIRLFTAPQLATNFAHCHAFVGLRQDQRNQPFHKSHFLHESNPASLLIGPSLLDFSPKDWPKFQEGGQPKNGLFHSPSFEWVGSDCTN